MNYAERAIIFTCADEGLVGILAIPEQPAGRGVLIVVGGPQYRVGSHRQYLILSRQLAEAGFPVLRFDYRGMGDSEGEVHTFEAVDQDILAAINAFFHAVPGLDDVVLWGLCDAASAALMYAPGDPRISGLALANPWVRTPDGLAKVMVRHYYGSRLLQKEFWGRLLSGRMDFLAALRGLVGNLRGGAAKTEAASEVFAPFPERMAQGLQNFSGRVLFFLSGQDLTAREFEVMIQASTTWRRALKRPQVEWRRLDAATHTFSRKDWRDQVSRWTIDWVKSW